MKYLRWLNDLWWRRLTKYYSFYFYKIILFLNELFRKMIETISIPSLDPLLILSLVVMNIGAKFLDIKLTDFQQKLIKNHLVQALILFSIVYIGTRDIIKSIIIVIMIYLLIYVLLNENHQFNIYSKRLLYNEGIIQNYNDIKDKYYLNIARINIDDNYIKK